MPESFDELYRGLSKEVFLEKAREQISQGQDALACADSYAGRGKPDFVLAFLLLSDATDDVKRDGYLVGSAISPFLPAHQAWRPA
jgi:hypothetical protein